MTRTIPATTTTMAVGNHVVPNSPKKVLIQRYNDDMENMMIRNYAYRLMLTWIFKCDSPPLLTPIPTISLININTYAFIPSAKAPLPSYRYSNISQKPPLGRSTSQFYSNTYNNYKQVLHKSTSSLDDIETYIIELVDIISSVINFFHIQNCKRYENTNKQMATTPASTKQQQQIFTSVFISCLFYGELYINRNHKKSTTTTSGQSTSSSLTLIDILIVSIVICIKMWIEEKMSVNKYISKIFGIPLQRLNQMEIQFLTLMDYQLYLDENHIKSFLNTIRKTVNDSNNNNNTTTTNNNNNNNNCNINSEKKQTVSTTTPTTNLIIRKQQQENNDHLSSSYNVQISPLGSSSISSPSPYSVIQKSPTTIIISNSMYSNNNQNNNNQQNNLLKIYNGNRKDNIHLSSSSSPLSSAVPSTSPNMIQTPTTQSHNIYKRKYDHEESSSSPLSSATTTPNTATPTSSSSLNNSTLILCSTTAPPPLQQHRVASIVNNKIFITKKHKQLHHPPPTTMQPLDNTSPSSSPSSSLSSSPTSLSQQPSTHHRLVVANHKRIKEIVSC